MITCLRSTKRTVWHFGLPCGSWVLLSRGTTLRTFLSPLGDAGVESVALANLLCARSAAPKPLCHMFLHMIIWRFSRMRAPQNNHFKRIFDHNPSFFGIPDSRNTPICIIYIYICNVCNIYICNTNKIAYLCRICMIYIYIYI